MKELLTKNLIFSVITLLTISISCKKKEDDFLVDMDINLVSANTLSYNDEIQFTIELNANKKIDRAEISIINIQAQNLLQGPTFEINSDKKTIAGSILLSDRYMPSGSYFLTCRAYDEDGQLDFEKSSFQYIELEKELLGFLTNRTPFAGYNEFYFFQFNNEGWNSIYEIPISCFDILYNERFESVVVPASGAEGIIGFNPFNAFQTGATSFPFIGSSPWNDVATLVENESYIFACQDQHVRIVKPNGSIFIDITMPLGWIPKQVASVEGRILVYCSNDNNSLHRLLLYNADGGFLIDTYNLLSAVQQMEQLNNDQIWIFQGEEEFPQRVFEVGAFFLNEWSGFRFAPSSPVISSLKTSQGLLLNHADGMRFYNANGIVLNGPLMIDNLVDWIDDPLNNLVWLLQNNQTIKGISLSSFDEVTTIPMPYQMGYLEVIYNK